MINQTKTRRADDAAGLGNSHFFAGNDTRVSTQNPAPAQVEKRLSDADLDRLGLLREAIHERLAFAIHRAELAIGFLEVQDDAGTLYCLTGFDAHWCFIRRTARDLRSIRGAGQ